MTNLKQNPLALKSGDEVKKEFGFGNLEISMRKLLSEAAYLLHVWGPESCRNWIESVGDCGKCGNCRVFRCIENLENKL